MKLSENYRLLFDENNVILQFHEMREKKKRDGSIENYEYQDNSYYNTVKSALKSFLNKELKGSESIAGIVQKIEVVEGIINGININQKINNGR